MNNYTPDTSSVLYAFVDGNKPRDEEEYLRLVAEFQDWLNEERAKAWDSGAKAMMQSIGDTYGTLTFIAPENPYRKADS